MPIAIDVGCNTDSVREDPLYIGHPFDRRRGPSYFALLDELLSALRRRYRAQLLVHFEGMLTSVVGLLLQCLNDTRVHVGTDFGTRNAFDLLQRYQVLSQVSPTLVLIVNVTLWQGIAYAETP